MAYLTDPTSGVGGALAILFGKGAGEFADPELIKGARFAADCAVADLAGDGLPELLVLDSLIGEVLVYTNPGRGPLADPVPYAVGDGPRALFVADLDGDRVPDVFAPNNDTQNVAVLRGRGDGTFEPALFSDLDGGATAAALGDLDEDGNLDAVVVGFRDGALLFGTGDGRFEAPVPFDVGGSPQSVSVADVNGDGLPDVVLVNGNARELVVYEGDGRRGLAEGYRFLTGSSGFPRETAVADLDGDLVPDIVLASGTGFFVLRGLGGGDFEPSPLYSAAESITDSAVLDVDGDGALDALALTLRSDGFTSFTMTLVLLRGLGDGTLESPCAYEAGSRPLDMVVADFDRDQVPDLALTNEGTGSVAVLIGDGDGSFEAPLLTDLDTNVQVLGAGDLNGNTLTDLVVAGSSTFGADLSLLTSLGDGGFDPPVTFESGGRSPTAVRVADLNQDLLPDIVVAHLSSNKLAVHLGEALGGYRAPLLFGTGISPDGLAVADVSGDGVPDLLTANLGEDSLSVLIGNGDGTFAPDVVYPADVAPRGARRPRRRRRRPCRTSWWPATATSPTPRRVRSPSCSGTATAPSRAPGSTRATPRRPPSTSPI